MFYSQFILAKKGPLGTIWIAAHLERKLRKNQVADTDIGVSVDSILFPDAPIALRLSSHLLLGVVRIYSRKVNYLFDDCSEALLKIKQAFRSTAVDLPPEESTAPYHSITLPETFDLDDFELPDNEILQGNYVDHHISSKDQITLQDTLDGVVYSTSKFGLDERFGDGDTSGVDLDEELFLEKVAAAGRGDVSIDPQASDQPAEAAKPDEYEIVGADVDCMDYAQAPCTPGLVEEPNLSNIKETSACDDHMDLEDNNLTDYASKENMEITLSKEHFDTGNKHIEDLSMHDNTNSDAVLHMAFENDSSYNRVIYELKPVNQSHLASGTVSDDMPSDNLNAAAEQPSSFAEQVVPPSMVSDLVHNGTAFDHLGKGEHIEEAIINAKIDVNDMPSDNLAPAPGQPSSFFEQAGAPSMVSDMAVQNRTVFDHLGKEEQIQEAIINGKTKIHPVDALRDDLEGPNCISLERNDGSVQGITDASQPAVEDVTRNSQSSAIADVHNKAETIEAPVHERMDSIHAPALRPCDVTLDKPEKSNAEGELCGATIETDETSRKPPMEESPSCESLQRSLGKEHGQVDNVNSSDNALEYLSSSAGCGFPAPEKLLAVPGQVPGLPRNMVVDATPQNVPGTNEDDAGNLRKKRTFTESTLTEQSLNSVESSRVVRSKRAVDFIPDDDDLLSSILVGRRSLALKVKPTPPPSEITSMRRVRSAPRNSASKRKVLMDDTMVLHGDMIRQQLTNTEDIRRIRKKAPCTRLEILMIQKQILEDEIFNDPVFIGMSKELALLHSHNFDLGRIKVSKDEQSCPLETAIIQRPASISSDNVMNLSVEKVEEFRIQPVNESGIEVRNESSVVVNGDRAEYAETSVLPGDKQGDQDNANELKITDALQLAENDHSTSNLFEPCGSQIDFSEKVSERNNNERGSSAADGVNPAVDTEVGLSCPVDGVSGNISDAQAYYNENSGGPEACMHFDADALSPTANAEVGLSCPADGDIRDARACFVEKSGIPEACMHVDASGVLPDQRIEPSTHMDASQRDMSRGEAANVNELAEKNDDITEFECERRMLDVASFEVAQDKADSYINHGGIQNLACNSIEEDQARDASFPPEYAHSQEASLDYIENVCRHEVNPPGTKDAETHGDVKFDFEDLNHLAAGDDTEFLNVDDDDVAEIGDDYMPDTQETRITENIGWSSRTRAVAKYLQNLFLKETEKDLSLDGLLTGKTRKEASRMFFESLVLKTKDYIHVEQGRPFNDITLKPQMKLIKSDF